jgi:hypothetical protein
MIGLTPYSLRLRVLSATTITPSLTLRPCAECFKPHQFRVHRRCRA